MKKNSCILIIVIVLLSIQLVAAQKRSGKQTRRSLSVKPIVNNLVQNDALILKQVKMKAEESGQALIAGEYESLYLLTHPKVRQIVGGKDKFAANLNKGMKEMRAEGFELIAMEAKEPEKIVQFGNQMFVIVPTKLKIQTPQGLFVQDSFDIAISEDKGRTWTLVGGGNKGKENLRKIFPAAAEKLDFPIENPPYPYAGQ